jgi:hypothetical protein
LKTTPKNTLTQDKLKELFDYDYDLGVFKRIKVTSYNTKIGDTVGSTRKDGYVTIGIDKKKYLAHRLIWLYVYGKYPDNLIDHKDGNKSNNRLDNLRDCTNLQNLQSKRLHPLNTSGYRGVTYFESIDRWRARICYDYKMLELGFFETPEQASDAYEDYAKKIRKEFYAPV